MFQTREAVRAGIVTLFSACTTGCLDPFTPPVGTHLLTLPRLTKESGSWWKHALVYKGTSTRFTGSLFPKVPFVVGK